MDEMKPYFTEIFGNAASRTHEFGWKADAAVEFGRKRIAKLIGANPRELYFTSGTTESVNLALKGIAQSCSSKGNQIITSAIEHSAVLDTCAELQRKGFKVTYLGADKYGMIDPDELKSSITDKTILVSIIFANNEIGTIEPVEEISRICETYGILFHTDAAQAAGKIPIDVNKLNIDLLSFGAHKLYGPKGIGVLYVKHKNPKIKLTPQISGGGHERGLRSGTLNVPAIVGFGKASEIARNEMNTDAERIGNLRDKFYNGITSSVKDVYINGHPEHKLYNNLNLIFAFADAETLMMNIKEIAVSSGSACSSASFQNSHVLKAIGVPEKLIKCSIRFGFGKFTTDEEIDYAVKKISDAVNKLRSQSPAYKMHTENKNEH
jgi:cysteine desulfurase